MSERDVLCHDSCFQDMTPIAITFLGNQLYLNFDQMRTLYFSDAEEVSANL